MKKGVIILWLAVVLAGVAVPLGYASALEPGDRAAAAGTALVSPAMAAANANAEQAASNQRAEAGKAIADVVAAPVKWLLGWTGKLVMQIIIWILEILLGIMALVLVVVGTFFNFVVDQLVSNMGTYVTSSSAIGIRMAWQTIRDLANIGIIGGIIAAAIGTILHMPTINAQKLLVRLIIAALLVNFSYFFAGAVIDSSNFLATAVYKSVITTKTCENDCNIAGRFLQLSNIQGLRDNSGRSFGNSVLPAWAQQLTNSGGGMMNVLFFDLFLLVFELVTIFIFASAITLLLGRFVALILVLITSPIGIAGLAIPKVNKYAKEWWEALFSQAFFAPVYFLLVGFSLTILENSKAALLSSTVGADSIFGTLLTFTVATVFMLQSLRIAKNLSEQSKKYLGDVYKGAGLVTKYGINYPLAVGARNSVGRGAEWLGYRYRDWAAKNEKFTTLPVINGIDRAIKSNLEKVKGRKFGGFESYGKLKEERKGREVELGEIKREQEQLEEARGKMSGKERKNFDALLKKARAGTLTNEESAQLNALAAKGGAIGLERLAGAGFWRQRALGDKLRGKDGKLESEEAFWARQRERDKEKLWIVDKDGKHRLETDEERDKRVKAGDGLGRKRGEAPTQYQYRLDQMKTVMGKDGSMKSYRQARGDAQSIFAAIPEGTIDRLIDENPNALLDFVSVLSPEAFLDQMKNTKIRRKTKNAARVLAHGEWAQMIQDIDDKVANGELIVGSKEYGEATAVPFYYAQKTLKNKEVFLDIIKSGAVFGKDAKGNEVRFEDLRKRNESIWDGSTSGMYMHVKDKFGTTEARRFASTKRRYLADQNRWLGAQIIFGREGFEKNEDGTLKLDADDKPIPASNPWLPVVPDSDNFIAPEEARKAAKSEVEAMNKTIKKYNENGGKASGISEETFKDAERRKRYAEMILRGPLSSLQDDALRAGAIAAAGDEISKARTKDEREAIVNRHIRMKRAEMLNAAAARLDAAETKDEREALLKSDDLAFAIDNQRAAETNLKGFMGGKSEDELKGIISPERSYALSTSLGMTAAQMGDIFGDHDIRFKRANRFTILATKTDDAIQEIIDNEHLRQKIDGWPDDPAEVEAINEIRVSRGLRPIPVNPFTEQKAEESGGHNDGNPGGNGGSGGPGQPNRPSGSSGGASSTSTASPVNLRPFAPGQTGASQPQGGNIDSLSPTEVDIAPPPQPEVVATSAVRTTQDEGEVDTLENLANAGSDLSDSTIGRMRTLVNTMTTEQLEAIPSEKVLDKNFIAALNGPQLNVVLRRWTTRPGDTRTALELVKRITEVSTKNKLGGSALTEWLRYQEGLTKK